MTGHDLDQAVREFADAVRTGRIDAVTAVRLVWDLLRAARRLRTFIEGSGEASGDMHRRRGRQAGFVDILSDLLSATERALPEAASGGES